MEENHYICRANSLSFSSLSFIISVSGIYIHIPFCATRCIYCDFYSTTLRGKAEDYVKALANEMAERKGFLRGHETEDHRWVCDDVLKTLYLGGGTPSQLGDKYVREILQAVSQQFDMSHVSEITMEANPDDIHEGQNWGIVNRISMGVQSMVDTELQLLHRRHDAAQVRKAVSILRNAGIHNISLDLMYGLPTQTMESWIYSIEEIIKLKPQHISAYNLSVEEGTKLNTMIDKGELTPCDDETCVEMASVLRKRLRAAGYEQYEISNYALKGYQSQHNSSYWTHTPYLGLGPGAHSYDGRQTRVSNLPRVLEYMKGNRQEEFETLSATDLFNERIMLGLRTMKGVWITEQEFLLKKHTIADLTRRGLIHCFTILSTKSPTSGKDAGDYNIVLSETGLALGDEVIRELMD